MTPAVLKINPVPSRWQRGFLLALHGVSCCVVWALAWPQALVLSGGVMLSLWWHWRQPVKISQLQCLPDGLCVVRYANGQELEMALQASSVLTSHVMVLHLKGDGARAQVLLWPDSADAEVLRQWRVYLRWIWPGLQRKKEVKEF
ncbi:hypothetical protein HQ393_06665 [Chitinibacter bivalviorum]|uniref:Toxin CptA n=1 Tax=Chitinibacter bivalviorum TaxID=2739434 RepID=A0A7H9BGX8_9NEIS|nr:protein YgfX [Chitinibacter bivalviorum]QLG87970.1 hypothetical protein HQ393_06665 [Chitinibacter bivalviorum]